MVILSAILPLFASQVSPEFKLANKGKIWILITKGKVHFAGLQLYIYRRIVCVYFVCLLKKTLKKLFFALHYFT